MVECVVSSSRDVPDLPFPPPDAWTSDDVREVAAELMDALAGLEAGGISALEGSAVIWHRLPDVVRWMGLVADSDEGGLVQ